jgi:hypothetical protein
MANFYVDTPVDWGDIVAEKNPATAHYIRRYSGGGKLWSHLLTDGTDDELMDFAIRLFGKLSARKWAQNFGTATAHFDCTPGMRQKAIKMGAIPIDRSAMSEIIRTKIRSRRLPLPDA